MRLLHISALPIWPLKGKGGMPSLRKTLQGHAQAGYDLTVIYPRYGVFSKDLEEVSVPKDSEYDIHLADCRWLPKLKYLRKRIKKFVGSNELPFAVRWILNMLTWFLLTFSLAKKSLVVRKKFQHEFSLIYAHNQYASLSGFLLGLIFRKPNITRLYGTFLADLMYKPLVWLRYPVAAAGFLVPCKLLICGNDGTRGDFVAERLKINPTKFRFWQNGLDLPRNTPSKDRKSLIELSQNQLRANSVWILSCSRLSQWKRIDRILRMVEFARKEGIDCQLILAGDGEEKENLIKLASQLKIEADVVWLGVVAHEKIWCLMNQADIFTITNDVTNRCNPLYEAMAAGLPILSVIDSATEDLLKDGENALLADRNDEQDLGKKLVKMCASKELREMLGKAHKSRVEQFWTWSERLAAEVKDIEKIIQRAQP